MTNKMTIDGKKNIETNIQRMEQRLQEIRDEKNLAYTATGDTWHDNPYFNKMEAEERAVELEINAARQLLREADILDSGERNTEVVNIGSIVKCECHYSDFDEITVLEIVGHGETDIDSGKIHYESPVAQSILGHKLNDDVDIKLPGGSATYKILKLYSDWDEVEKDG